MARTGSFGLIVYGAAYIIGWELALAATLGWIGAISPAKLLWHLAWLGAAPAFWFVRRQSPISADRADDAARTICDQRRGLGQCGDWKITLVSCLVVALTSLVSSLWTASLFNDSRPCFLNEHSHILQAETFLRGRLWFPSHPTMPDLFDQMHVLNEGKFASRYFPGTALWMAPFVAMDHPYWGHWLAGVMIAVLVFGTGCDLAGNLCGFIAGMVVALSPGMAIFSNLLLSSHPATLGLSFFMFGFFRVQSTRSWTWALLGGIGLAFAILCRPLTAAGVAAPFALAIAVAACRRSSGKAVDSGSRPQGGGSFGACRATECGVGGSLGAAPSLVGNAPQDRTPPAWSAPLATTVLLPIVVALGGMLLYNHAITGSEWKSPWQLYNEIYTPRHAYGFDNGIRGDAAQGPKVVTAYDLWAENLTIDRALDNVGTRLAESCRWTLGAIPLAMAGVVMLLTPGWRRAGWLVLGGIAGLHAAYVPYWFTGTLGFHYVFETIPLWALAFGLATSSLFHTWHADGRHFLSAWWIGSALLALGPMYLPQADGETSAVEGEIASLAGRRAGHARFLRLLEAQVTQRPALVLVEQGMLDSFVVNSPGLDRPVIFGRYQPNVHLLDDIAVAFPARTIYLFRQDNWDFERISVPLAHSGK